MAPPPDEAQRAKDQADLEKLGYVQELVREMGGFSSFAISFSVMSILTGTIQLYGYGLQHGGPLLMTMGWGLVSVFTIAIALFMAEMASAYPTAGALYHWSSFLGGRTLGWFTACFNTVGLLGVVAGVDYGLAQLLAGFFGWSENARVAFFLYLAILFSHALFNHVGVRVLAWLNHFSAWYHMVVTALLIGVLVFFGLSQPPSFLLEAHHFDGYPYPYSFLIGLLLAQWILVGYDASAHVSEETLNPRQTAPWAIFSSVIVTVVVGFALFAALTLAVPNLREAAAFGDNAFAEVLKLRLGGKLGRLFVGMVLGAVWMCGLASLTSASRMVYAFARDGGLPFSKFWARVSPKYRTPANAIWALAILSAMLAASVSVYSAVVSVAIVALHISYGLALGAGLVAQVQGRFVKGSWHLGPFSKFVGLVSLLWICFIVVVFLLPPNEQAAKALLLSLVSLIVLWFAFVRRRFQGPPLHEIFQSKDP